MRVYGVLVVSVLMTLGAVAAEPADPQAAGTEPAPAAAAQPAAPAEPEPSPAGGRIRTPTGDDRGGASQPGTVARSAFTSNIVDREPADQILSLSNQERRIYYFTELQGLKGHTVVHRWEHDGKVMAVVEFPVKGSRWRVWSSKNLLPKWLGKWKVSVVDEDGTVLAEDSFTYRAMENGDAAAQP